MVPALPDNFRRLWQAEDDLIQWSTDIIARQVYLVEHVDLIEAYLDCIETMRLTLPKGERHVALGGLFLRQFDALSHGLRAAMSGNYTGCAMYARDALETVFLTDFLLDEPGRPEEWLQADQKTARNKFGANEVRIALDKRDGFTTGKRRAHFDMLSVLGSHPRPLGLELKRDGTRAINAGPFKQAETLELSIQELARLPLAGSKSLLSYCRAEIPDGVHFTSRLSLAVQRSYEKHYTPT